MIRNVVFDMGNVLLRFSPEQFLTREGVLDPEDRKLLRNELFLSVEWALMDLGALSEDTAEPLIAARLPERLREKASELLHNWSRDRETVPGMEEIVRRLKAAGYRLYLLSNASVGQPDYWNRLEMSRLFDGTLISAFVKTVKPGPEIYRLFIKKFALKEDECVFIDDSHANVAAAVNLGWKGIVFHGEAEEAERKLKELGLRF